MILNFKEKTKMSAKIEDWEDDFEESRQFSKIIRRRRKESCDDEDDEADDDENSDFGLFAVEDHTRTAKGPFVLLAPFSLLPIAFRG